MGALVWLPMVVALVLCQAPARAQEPTAREATSEVSHRVAVRLDPAERRLTGQAEILVRGAGAFELVLNGAFEPSGLLIDGKPGAPRPRRVAGTHRWSVPATGAGERHLRLEWSGPLAAPATGREHRDTLGPQPPTADVRGSFLPAGTLWYPTVVRGGRVPLHDYRVVLDLPQGQRGLVAGTRTDETGQDGRVVAHFEFPYPSEGIDLMSGPYRVSEETTQSIDGRPIALRTYFHPELEALAPGYLEAVRDYLALYESWIGPYPFTSFSVVSSPTPTGFGMPSLTYLGIEVLKLPFIKATSLGHEVLHNWWGNGVYPDYAAGNWSEGLTTFMADYAYAVRAGSERAAAMRLGWLRQVSGIPPGADRPLADFTARRHGVSQAVGYAKAAMLFVMLEDRIGEAAFTRAVRRFWHEHRFTVASWQDLQAAFEAESGERLGRFFEQWLERSGLPELTQVGARRTAQGVSVSIGQSDPPYELDLPLRVEAPSGGSEHRVRLDRARQRFELETADPAQRLVVDPEHRTLRRLARFEAPPILREVQLDHRARLLVLGSGEFARTARELAVRMLDHDPPPAKEDELPGEDALLAVGPADRIERWLVRHGLPPRPKEVAAAGDVRMWTFRLPSGAPLAVVSADSTDALAASSRPLPHYGQQSWLVLREGKAGERGVWPARPPAVDIEN